MEMRTWLIPFTAPLAIACAGPAAAQCEQEVEQTLQQLGVPQNDVESVEIKRRQRSLFPTDNFDYDAWVRLRHCARGHLVINMSRACYVRQTYTEGNCRVAGVDAY